MANQEMRKDISTKQSQLAEFERAKNELQELLRTQTITHAGLDSKLKERSRLKRQDDEWKMSLQMLEDEGRDLQERRQQSQLKAETLVIENHELSAKLRHDEDQDSRDNGPRPILGSPSFWWSKDVRIKVKGIVSGLRAKFDKGVTEISDELFILQEQLESLNDAIEEHQQRLNGKDYNFGQLTRKIQEEKEVRMITKQGSNIGIIQVLITTIGV